MAFDLQEWYDKMHKGNVILAYKGTITADLIGNVLDSVEEKLEDESSKVRRKVYNVLVETLQNLYHHIDNQPELELDSRLAIFVFSKHSDGQYKISTGTFVAKARLKLLKDRLDQLNFLSTTELKSLYKLILNNDEFSEKGGGGLGMIDIARKTGNKFGYQFQNVNEDYYFFNLEVIVN